MVDDKRKKIILEIEDLQEEREACNRQYRSAIDDAQKVRIKRKLDDLDKTIDNLERQLGRKDSTEDANPHSGRLPPLLTYDLDRGAQEFELSQKIEKLSPSSPKPLICLIHGDKDECHDKFIKCLEKTGLRRLLSLKPNLAPCSYLITKWPSQIDELDNFHKRYCMHLAAKILDDNNASQQQINDWLASIPAPVIIESEFFTRSWKKHAAKVVIKVLDFWQDWPPLAPNQVLLVCLCIKYPVPKPPPIFKVFGYKPIAEVVSASLKALSHSHDNQIILAVLSTLKGVTQQDTEEWVRDNESYLLSRYGEDVLHDLKKTIRSQFEQCQSQEDPKRIPMEDVTERLRIILQKHSRQREESIQ